MPIEQAPHLAARIKRQQAIEATMEIQGNTWKWTLGDYTDRNYDIYNNHHSIREITTGKGKKVILKGYEVFLHDTALQLLKTRKRPLVMLDLGGGAGASWNRLAIALEDEIEQSRIALVVSNIAATPEQQLQRFDAVAKDIPPLAKNFDTDIMRTLLDETEGLVHYVTGPFFSLRMQHITLPNGQKIRLEENTDFIAELRSLTKHTKTPELDLAIVGFLLSEFGMYTVPNHDVLLINEKSPFTQERREGIQIGHRMLEQQFVLRRIYTAESGRFAGEPFTNHHVFKATSSSTVS